MASSRPRDETTEMENRNRRIRRRVETLGAWPEKIPPSLRGLEIRNVPAAGEVFFLDFSFYRTSRDLAQEGGGDDRISNSFWIFPVAQFAAAFLFVKRSTRASETDCCSFTGGSFESMVVSDRSVDRISPGQLRPGNNRPCRDSCFSPYDPESSCFCVWSNSWHFGAADSSSTDFNREGCFHEYNHGATQSNCRHRVPLRGAHWWNNTCIIEDKLEGTQGNCRKARGKD